MAAPVPPSPLLLRRLKANGILSPYWTWRQARVARLGLPVACALLTDESSGGRNEFGHDSDSLGPCPGYGWGEVTEARYLAFRRLRDLEHRSNGVGPMQLTSPSLQDQADALGGCWVVRYNLAVGFHYAHDLMAEHGPRGGLVAYNGSGPAAERYADRVLELAARFKRAGCGTVVGIY